jgi:two-component system sensor histidine kinase/response regulator
MRDRPETETLPGIDIADARKNLNCDWVSFKKILGTFHSQNKNGCREIEVLLEQGAIEEARELAHKIKGGSGYISAWRLFREAGIMEDVCGADNYGAAIKQLPQFCESLDEVIDSIAGLDEPNKPIA